MLTKVKHNTTRIYRFTVECRRGMRWECLNCNAISSIHSSIQYDATHAYNTHTYPLLFISFPFLFTSTSTYIFFFQCFPFTLPLLSCLFFSLILHFLDACIYSYILQLEHTLAYIYHHTTHFAFEASIAFGIPSCVCEKSIRKKNGYREYCNAQAMTL